MNTIGRFEALDRIALAVVWRSVQGMDRKKRA